MNLKPLGARVLIKPAEPVEMTDSGLHLVEHKKPEQIGTVVAVGTPVHPLKAEADTLVLELRKMLPECIIDQDESTAAAIYSVLDLLEQVVRRGPCCAVGDTVLFSWSAGQEIYDHDADERYLLLNEADLLAVVET